jgi:hypothetical protein
MSTVIVGAQLTLWVVTGFAFTLFDFRAVRGEDDRARPTPLDPGAIRLSPADALTRARALRPGEAMTSARITTLGGRVVWDLESSNGGDVLLDATSGVPVVVDAELAGKIAVAAFAKPTTVQRVLPESHEPFSDSDSDSDSTASSDSKRAPRLWRVVLDDERRTEMIVDARTGAVTSRQNVHWRRFDTLWSLHVLGYVSRESPANWPLRVVAFLACMVVVSGIGLWMQRIRTSMWKGNRHGLS